MKTTARLAHEKIRFDLPFRTHLVVGLEAPPVDWQSRRPPVCVIPVVDVSGSMAGAKLDRAKKSVQKLVDNLSPGDFCGVVTFSDDVTVVSPPVQMSQPRKDALKTEVERLEAQSSTNLAGGMLEGLRLANESSLPGGMLVRVILFTDGCANVGVATKSPALLPLLEANRGRATLSAFGYGADADQELLRDLSTRGKGNYAFVAGPDDAMTAFARELGGLLSTHAQDIVLHVRPSAGSRITAVLSDVDADPEDGGSVRVRIPDILAEEKRQVVLAVEVPAASTVTAVPETAFAVDATWTVIAPGSLAVKESCVLEARVERVAAGAEQLRPAAELDAVVAQAQLVRAQIEAEEMARRGEHVHAHEHVNVLYQEFRGRGLEAEATAAREVAGTMEDAGAFRRTAAYRSSMRKGMGRSSSVMLEGDADRTLKKMGLSRETTAQKTMDDLFKGKDPGAPAPRRRARKW